MQFKPFSYYLFIFAIFLCFLLLWRRRKMFLLSFQLHGPNVFQMIQFSYLLKSEELLDRLLKITSPYPSPVRFWLGPRLMVLVKDPDQLQVLMQSSKMSTKSFIYRFLEPFMRKGLFTSSGFQHRSHRKLLQPLFGPKVVEGYSSLFQKHALKLSERLKSYVDKEAFDILLLIHDSAFETTIDIMLDDRDEHSIDYKCIPACIRRFYHIFIQRSISFWMYPDCLYKLTNYYKEQQKIEKITAVLTEEVKASKVPELLNKLVCKRVVNKDDDDPRAPSMLEAMVKMVLDDPQCLSEKEIMDHMLTFVATGQDTQSTTIAFTLMMLGIHPEIQRKVVEEVRAVVGDKRCIDFDDTGKLKYLEMCIKESMRLFPVGPFLPRDVVEEFQLGKWTLPVGCTVVFSVFQVHRNPKLWERPEEFYPEHFTSEAISKRHPFAFIPFSAGPRRCIAQHFSYINMKILLSTILLNYIIECEGTIKNLKLITDISIRPANGYMVKLKNRNGCPS